MIVKVNKLVRELATAKTIRLLTTTAEVISTQPTSSKLYRGTAHVQESDKKVIANIRVPCRAAKAFQAMLCAKVNNWL